MSNISREKFQLNLFPIFYKKITVMYIFIFINFNNDEYHLARCITITINVKYIRNIRYRGYLYIGYCTPIRAIIKITKF